jgi:hypothetical protein
MHCSGLILTLERDAASRADALARLERWPGLTLGERAEPRIAAALEAEHATAALIAVDALRAAPGVVHVDVVFAEVSAPCAAEFSS